MEQRERMYPLQTIMDHNGSKKEENRKFIEHSSDRETNRDREVCGLTCYVMKG